MSSASAWGDDQTKFFFGLTPDRVLEAVEASGFLCTGLCVALNSFENRVYEVELDPESIASGSGAAAGGRNAYRRIVKFYRPGRWSREQILEEHEFIRDLNEAEIPAVAPLPFPDGQTLHQTREGGIWYAIFPKIGGRAPDELSDEQLVRIGRLLARIHSVGALKQAPHRVRLDPGTYGLANLGFLLQGDWIALESRARFKETVESLCATMRPWFEATPVQRVHGDCHLGNLLWNDQGPFFVDFDDMVRAPVVQDMWLMIPGRPTSDEFARRQLELLLEGYEEMRAFDRAQLKLIEPLRALRFVHYSAWIARRWNDPAFPLAFPQFGTPRYWNDLTDDLGEQLRCVQAIGTHA